MQRWLVNGLGIGSITVAAVGAAVLLWPNSNGAIALAGGTTGAVGSAILSRQQEKRSQQTPLHIRKAIEATLTPHLSANSLLSPVTSTPVDAQTLQEIVSSTIQPLLVRSLQPCEQSLQQTRQELGEALVKLGRQQQSLQDQLKLVKQQLHILDQQLLLLQASVEHGESSASPTETFPTEVVPPAKPPISFESKPLPEVPEPKNAIAWLKERQITVKDYRKIGSSAIDRALDEVALYLGEHYDTLKAFHRQIMSHARVGKQFFFPLYGRNQEEIRINTTFGSLLRKYGCVANYDYSDSEKIMSITPHRREEFTRFFFGDWFERFIHHRVVSFFKAHGFHSEVLMNATVVFPNQDEYELDLFFWVQGYPLWIECKAGKSFDQYIQPYSNRGEILGIPKANALMVVLNLPETQAEARTEMWELTVANQDTLIPRIRVAIAPLFNTLPPTPDNRAIVSTMAAPPESTALSSSASTPLSQAKLKPARQHRITILNALVQRMSVLPLPISCYDIKTDLIQHFTNPNREGGLINATPINDVLRTLLIGDCFLDIAGNSVKSFHLPIASLVSTDVAELEARCIETYATKVMSIDANYFDLPQHVARFEAQVGGKVPDPAALERLKINLLNHPPTPNEPAA